MYFRLLSGVHREQNGTIYQVKLERTDTGVMVPVDQPVVKSDCDLVKAFGANKFRRLTDAEIEALGLDVTESMDQVDSVTSASGTQVAVAAKKGAIGIAEPPGKNVTGLFPRATEAGLKIYRKGKGAYIVHDSQDEVVTAEGPITRRELLELIGQYAEN